MPKYRVLEDYTPIVPPNLYMRGAVVEFPGWPRWTHGAVEPADDDARAIFNYFRVQNVNPFLPAKPTDKHGRIYLPAIFPDPRSTELLGVASPTDEMPRYTVIAEVIIGCTRHAAGDEVVYLGWPNSILRPANDVARLIAEYHEANHAHPDLPTCPYNLFDNSPYLPELDARPLQRVQPSPPDDWPRPRAQQPLPPPVKTFPVIRQPPPARETSRGKKHNSPAAR
jgi:hypothetical protein